MSVDVRRMVETMGGSLMAGQVFQLEADYQQRTAFTLGTLLVFAAQEWDRSVERLVEENGAVRALFRDAAPDVQDRELRARVEQAVASADPGLRVKALLEENGRLRALLIELHAHVEAREDAAAGRIDEAIWRELVTSTERRQLEGAPF